MRRWVLAFLMAVTANWVSLIYAFGPVSWLLTTILLLGEFLYFNLRPIEKSGAPTKRIWYLKSGCELLRLFLIIATVTVFVQMVWLWCQISMITPENSLAAGTAVAGTASHYERKYADDYARIYPFAESAADHIGPPHGSIF